MKVNNEEQIITDIIGESYANLINITYTEQIKTTKSIEKLKDLYNFVTDIIPNLYVDGKMTESYEEIIKEILRSERYFVNTYVMESSPITKKSNYSELDMIVNEVRHYLIKTSIARDDYPLNLDHQKDIYNQILVNSNFINYCPVSSRKVNEVCKKRGLKSRIIEINPGYQSSAGLYNGSGFHRFNIVIFNNKEYIVDCAYRQFFTENYNCFERINIINLSGCKAGFFMKQDEKRKKVATQILKYGYIELTPENLKSYLDGFTMSFRNGLYYVTTGDYSFQTEYTTNDYEKFLTGQDNQINHEGREVLGYQKRPSKVRQK